jgi:hypothetical protein
MKANPLLAIQPLGQSLWLDCIQRTCSGRTGE